MKGRESNFQVFIISRFLVMIIIVIMSEFLVFFAMDLMRDHGVMDFPVMQFLITLFLFTVPIVGSAVWFARIVVEEVQRREREEEEIRLKYERARNLMLSDIAHDLRTPITTIAGYSKAINDGLISDESTYLGINELGSSAVKYLIKIRCNQEDRYTVKREILGRIKLAYEKNKIKIPYNQIEVHHGQSI